MKKMVAVAFMSSLCMAEIGAIGQAVDVMALGGIGTGYLEITENGVFRNFEPHSNLTVGRPAPRMKVSLVSAAANQSKSMTLLDTARSNPPKQSFGAKGLKRFPAMTFEYGTASVNSVVPKVKVISSFAPGNLDLSNVPAALMIVNLKNNQPTSKSVKLIFQADNPSSEHGTSISRQFHFGDVTGRISETSDHFGFATGAAADRLGPLPTTTCFSEVNRTTYSVIVTVRPRASHIVTFGFSWYSPWNRDPSGKRTVNRYALRFTDAGHVLRTALSKRSKLENLVSSWHGAIDRRKIPEWLKTSLKNSFENYCRQSNCSDLDELFVPDFSSEATRRTTGLLSGNVMDELFFPKLAENTLLSLSHMQAESGELPGNVTWSAHGQKPLFGSDRTTASAAFVLLCHRHWKSSGSAGFLNAVIPMVKKAAQFSTKLDTDDDGLINEIDETPVPNSGHEWHGTAIYTACISVASNLALKEMAEFVGDHNLAASCEARISKGTAAIETLLWSGKHYRTYSDPDQFRQDDRYFPNQLDGQLVAWQSGSPSFLPLDHIRKSLAQCLANTNRGLSSSDVAIFVAAGIISNNNREDQAKWLDFVTANTIESRNEPNPAFWSLLLAIEGRNLRFQQINVR